MSSEISLIDKSFTSIFGRSLIGQGEGGRWELLQMIKKKKSFHL